MPKNIDALLADDEQTTAPGSKDIDALLADDSPSAESAPAAAAGAEEKPERLPWWRRAAAGWNDPNVGPGQLMQHVLPDSAMNVARKSVGSIVSAIPGAERVGEDIMRPVSTEEFDQRVKTREGEITAGGDGKIDWWRVAGTVANPLSWVGGGPGKSGVMQAVKAGAKAGAFQALMQPVTSDGNFAVSKAQQAVMGGAVGGGLSGALAAFVPALSLGIGKVKQLLGKEAPSEAIQQQATKATEDALQAAEIDPAKVDPNLWSAIQKEAADALKAGVDPDPRVIERRADAASLPVPIQLTRGQASRDPFQYSWEQNQGSKLQDVGLPLSERLQEQNRQLIENLNVLGARNAPASFDTSSKIIQHIEGIDAQLKAKVDEAYKAVRDSAGRPARVDNDAFVQRSKELLTDGNPEMASLTSLADYLPDKVANVYNNILQGKLPLTVDTIQFLDRAWGDIQRKAENDTARKAIGHLRTALNEAPVNDALGAEAMAAYKTARGLARQRFALMEANPAYKAVNDGVEPDKFFQKYVQGANVADLQKLTTLIGPQNTKLLQSTFMGNLKKQVLSRATDEDATFSQAALNRVLQDEVQAPRLRALFASDPNTLAQLYRLGRVSEDIGRYPKGHSVNTSNTAVTAANILKDMAKSEAGSALVGMIPGGRAVQAITQQAKEKAAAVKAVDEAIKPGVTRATLPTPSSKNTGRISDLLARSAGATVAKDEDE